jgi:hypothetical protein
MTTLVGLLLTTDLWFWDNAVATGAGVGQRLADGRWVTAFDAARHDYEVRAVRTAPVAALQASTEADETHAIAEVRVRLAPGAPLDAAVLAGPATRLPTIPAGHPVPDHPVPIETLAPFPVNVSYPDAQVVPGPVALPKGYWPIVAGQSVRLERTSYVVQRVDADRATLLGAPERVDRVPNPNDRVVPSGYVVALGSAFAAAIGGARVTRLRRERGR